MNDPTSALRSILLSIKLSAPAHPESEDFYNLNIALRQLGLQDDAVKLSWRLIERAMDKKKNIAPGAALSPLSPPSSPPTPPPTSFDPSTVNIICVKYGKKYGAEYVNHLFAGVRRNTRGRKVSFFCLTDDQDGINTNAAGEEEDVTIIPLNPKPFKSSRRNPAGWWHKACLFNPTIKEQFFQIAAKNVYIDLDTVVVGDLGGLIDNVKFPNPDVKFATLTTDDMVNERRKNGLNTSVMVWENSDFFDSIYTHLDFHFDVVGKYIYKLDHWFEMMFVGCGEVGGCGHVKEYKKVKEDGVKEG